MAVDSSGKVIGQRIGVVPEGVPGFSSVYFQVGPLPAAASYRVTCGATTAPIPVARRRKRPHAGVMLPGRPEAVTVSYLTLAESDCLALDEATYLALPESLGSAGDKLSGNVQLGGKALLQ